jgi:hypothetical protein
MSAAANSALGACLLGAEKTGATREPFSTGCTMSGSLQGKPRRLGQSARIAERRRQTDRQAARRRRHVRSAGSLHEPGVEAIEKVDVSVACADPTIADAVALVLKQKGRSARPEDPDPGVTSNNMVIDGAAGGLVARCYRPDGTGPFSVVVYFHGGGWVIRPAPS